LQHVAQGDEDLVGVVLLRDAGQVVGLEDELRGGGARLIRGPFGGLGFRGFGFGVLCERSRNESESKGSGGEEFEGAIHSVSPSGCLRGGGSGEKVLKAA